MAGKAKYIQDKKEEKGRFPPTFDTYLPPPPLKGGGKIVWLKNLIHQFSYSMLCLTYFNLQQGQAKTFTVRLQATYSGDFVMPAIQCEAMYDANVQARTQAGRTKVVRQSIE